MTIKLQVGNTIHEFPVHGDINWGESVTDWAQAVTDALATVQGPQDILITEALLANNQVTPAIISGLAFNTAVVQQIVVEALIIRTFTDMTPTRAETAISIGAYNGSVFSISTEYVGDECGVILDCNNSGQFTYTSSDVPNTDTITIKFKGKAITV
jgi:hypothetical protein